MTAEEKLKELKEQNKSPTLSLPYPVRIDPEDIDLIANLVVERLKNDQARS